MAANVSVTHEKTLRQVILFIDPMHARADYAKLYFASRGWSPVTVSDPFDGLKAAREWRPRAVVIHDASAIGVDIATLSGGLRSNSASNAQIVLVAEPASKWLSTKCATLWDAVISPPFSAEQLLSILRHGPITAHSPADDGALYWSKRGEIACAKDSPDMASFRWRNEGWALIDSHYAVRRRYQCQHCSLGPFKRRSDR